MPLPKPPTLDDEIRALYQGPLAAFTPGRLALAKRLHREADPREAEVQKLCKPTSSAWAVDRLFAMEARAMAALVAAGKEARATPRTGADGASVRRALERIRAETERLLGAATELLTAAAAPPGAAVLERVRQNLDALALDPANAELAARGWLDVDLDAPGFEVMAALQIAAEEGRGAGPAGRGGGSWSAAVARPGPAQAKRAERQRRERVEAARRELARAEKRAAELRETADESAHAAERAAFAAAQAAQQADQARRAAQEAKRAAESAAAEVAKARETLRQAERGD